MEGIVLLHERDNLGDRGWFIVLAIITSIQLDNNGFEMLPPIVVAVTEVLAVI